ncbi:MAG: hypothetical protein JJT85_06625 [Chromatiales bacterium]|nr:hypothetical protein [Chromatiales bacterium]
MALAIVSWAASSWYAAMIVGATMGYLTTGSLEGALFGAVSGLTAYGFGTLPGFTEEFGDTLWRAASSRQIVAEMRESGGNSRICHGAEK